MKKPIHTLEEFFVGMKFEDFKEYKEKCFSLNGCTLEYTSLGEDNTVDIIKIELPYEQTAFFRKFLAEKQRVLLSERYGIPADKLNLYKVRKTLTKLD